MVKNDVCGAVADADADAVVGGDIVSNALCFCEVDEPYCTLQ